MKKIFLFFIALVSCLVGFTILLFTYPISDYEKGGNPQEKEITEIISLKGIPVEVKKIVDALRAIEEEELSDLKVELAQAAESPSTVAHTEKVREKLIALDGRMKRWCIKDQPWALFVCARIRAFLSAFPSQGGGPFTRRSVVAQSREAILLAEKVLDRYYALPPVERSKIAERILHDATENLIHFLQRQDQDIENLRLKQGEEVLNQEPTGGERAGRLPDPASLPTPYKGSGLEFRRHGQGPSSDVLVPLPVEPEEKGLGGYSTKPAQGGGA